LSATNTTSASATAASSSVARGTTVKSQPGDSTRTPRSAIAAGCAPLAIKVTSAPPRVSRAVEALGSNPIPATTRGAGGRVGDAHLGMRDGAAGGLGAVIGRVSQDGGGDHQGGLGLRVHDDERHPERGLCLPDQAGWCQRAAGPGLRGRCPCLSAISPAWLSGRTDIWRTGVATKITDSRICAGHKAYGCIGGRRSAKPSAQPTLVRTQHLPQSLLVVSPGQRGG